MLFTARIAIFGISAPLQVPGRFLLSLSSSGFSKRSESGGEAERCGTAGTGPHPSRVRAHSFCSGGGGGGHFSEVFLQWLGLLSRQHLGPDRLVRRAGSVLDCSLGQEDG